MKKKIFVAFVAAIVLVLIFGATAQAKQVRTTTGSAVAESEDWTNHLDVWTWTEKGNRFMIHRNDDDTYEVIFDYDMDLGNVEGVKLEDAVITYYFDGMSNTIVEYLMKY